MVTHSQDPSPDSSYSFNSDDSCESKEIRFTLSNPTDRLAANVIDTFIVLSPLLLVLIAPFKRMLREAILFENSFDFLLASSLCVLTVLFFSFLYKTYLTWRYGGTLGQLFMSLRVVNIWEPKEKKRVLGDHILRSAYWIFSYMLLGLPFLSIMSNEKRRCFHDRVSDMIVLSFKRGTSSPSSIEKLFARLILACVLSLGFLSLFPTFYLLYNDVKKQDHLTKFLEENGTLCPSVEMALPEWPEENGPTRLSVAMALYAAAEIEESCLKSEVDFAYRSGVESGIADLASAFVYADNTELSEKYLTAVCKDHPSSESCQMSRIIELWSEDTLTEINSLFKKFGPSPSIYVTVWGIRHFYRNNQYTRAMEMLKSINHVRRLTDFFSLQMVKLYWVNMKTHEARISAETAMTAMSERGRLSLNNWLCFEERTKNCNRHDSCDYVESHWKKNPESLDSNYLALTFLKNSICKNKDYNYVRKKIPTGLVSDLAMALGSKNKKRSLEDYLKKSPLTPRLRAEALRELISIDSMNNLGKRTEDWLAAKRNWEWEKTGHTLFQRLSQLKIWDRAYEVGQILLNRQPRDIQLQEDLVVAAYKSKRVNQAQRILSDYYQKKEPTHRDRRPASRHSFSRVARQLESLGNQ